jgi:O-antigen/teichoic acid export membrane protein
MDVVQRVQLGLQQGYRYGLWQLCGSSSGLIGVVMGIRLHVGLPILVIAIAGAPIFATALNAAHFFGIMRPDLRPSPSMVSKSVIAQIAKLGGMFFVLQVVVAISYSADNFIIARTLGAVNVPEYSIPQRLFTLISMITAMLASGLWPAYGEAISRGHIPWVRRTLRKSISIIVCASAVAAGSMYLASGFVLHLWVGSRIHPSSLLLAGLAVWCVIECGGNALAVFLNGAAAMKFQVIVTACFGIGCLLTKIYFIRHFGIAAIPWATIITFIVFALVPWVIYVPRLLSRLQRDAEASETTAESLRMPEAV